MEGVLAHLWPLIETTSSGSSLAAPIRRTSSRAIPDASGSRLMVRVLGRPASGTCVRKERNGMLLPPRQPERPRPPPGRAPDVRPPPAPLALRPPAEPLSPSGPAPLGRDVVVFGLILMRSGFVWLFAGSGMSLPDSGVEKNLF